MKQTVRFGSFLKQDMPFFMAMPALVWQIMLFYVPFVLVAFMSITKPGTFSGPQSFTLEHITTFFDPMYLAIILRSWFLALASAIICVLCAYPIAYYIAFTVRRWKKQLLFLFVLPLWLSFLVQVYAWFFVLEKHGLINGLLLKIGLIAQPIQLLNTPFAVFLVMVYCYMPFAVMSIYSSLEKFDIRLFEASADLGSTRWQTFMRVTLPLSASGMRTGFFLVLVPAFGEFVIPVLLSGGKQFYVGSLISHYFLTAYNIHAGAAFTCICGALLLITSALVYLIFKRMFGTIRSDS
jgi:spermidine/putrescine transport system permease protein